MQEDEKLHTPSAFYSRFRDHFPVGTLRTYRALQYHLSRRRENRLVEAGAVQDGKFGVLVHPARFLKWLLLEQPSDQDAA